MSQNNAKTNANSDSKDYTEKTTNNNFVIQTSVIQTHSKETFTNTSLSHRDTLDTLNETHTNSLVSQSNNPSVSQLYDMDYIDIQKLLQRIKMSYRASKHKDAKIEIRVDQDTKLAWDIIVGHERRLLEMIISPGIISLIESCAIYKGLIKPEEGVLQNNNMVIFQPQIHVTVKEEPKEEKRKEELKDEFKQKFKEFNKFLNELIFTPDNLINNAYLVTKPLVKKLFQYIDELVNMDSTPPEAKQLLMEMKGYLAMYPLAERNFKNGIASIPTGVHKEEIMPRLTKIEKLLS
ncbi:hypothetical protein [Acidianus sp.]|uniref:hypothetical protein n=1 Tax=Acidianus sp. TaxID=1872104 RepID=UPI00397D65D3